MSEGESRREEAEKRGRGYGEEGMKGNKRRREVGRCDIYILGISMYLSFFPS